MRINFDKPERGSWDSKALRQDLITQAGKGARERKSDARDVGGSQMRSKNDGAS